MLDRRKGDRPVHTPANPDKFEFDAEVSAIFPDMARRSIPNYETFHKLHARMVKAMYSHRSYAPTVLDIGASHGAFLTELEHTGMVFRSSTAIDNSPSMCHYLEQKLPCTRVLCLDLDSDAFMGTTEKFDVINCTYVLQFIRPELQMKLLWRIMGMVNHGGMLILGQKEPHHGVLGAELHERYIEWRIANGYTREEIEAKTQALKGSMWPMDQKRVLNALRPNFREITETSRMFMFSTLVALK
jgi:tRNA (cmo5U34)-methyltransferase